MLVYQYASYTYSKTTKSKGETDFLYCYFAVILIKRSFSSFIDANYIFVKAINNFN